MTLDNFLEIASLALAVVCYIGYRWCSKNVYLKYKEQTVVVNNEKEGKK